MHYNDANEKPIVTLEVLFFIVGYGVMYILRAVCAA